MLLILPMMQQGSLHANWNFRTNVKGNQTLAQTDIPTFYCPSRRNEVRQGIDSQMIFDGMADGSVQFLSENLNAMIFERLCTMQEGVPVGDF